MSFAVKGGSNESVKFLCGNPGKWKKPGDSWAVCDEHKELMDRFHPSPWDWVRVCEICGNTATHLVRDIYRKVGPGGYYGFVEQEPGPIHSFCDDHAKEPEVIHIN